MLAILTMTPLLFGLDLADTSTMADKLMTELIRAGIRGGPKCHLKISWLESGLSNLSARQGLGVEVLGVVIDKRALGTFALWLGGGLVTLITALLAVVQDAAIATAGAELCALSQLQISITKDLYSSNGSCSYDNVTIGSVLRLKTDDEELATIARPAEMLKLEGVVAPTLLLIKIATKVLAHLVVPWLCVAFAVTNGMYVVINLGFPVL